MPRLKKYKNLTKKIYKLQNLKKTLFEWNSRNYLLFMSLVYYYFCTKSFTTCPNFPIPCKKSTKCKVRKQKWLFLHYIHVPYQIRPNYFLCYCLLLLSFFVSILNGVKWKLLHMWWCDVTMMTTMRTLFYLLPFLLLQTFFLNEKFIVQKDNTEVSCKTVGVIICKQRMFFRAPIQQQRK